MRNHTFYICYFGLREPLVQTQVLPYLKEIKKPGDWRISLLTFEPSFKEKWSAAQIETEKAKLLAEGIEWHVLPYHKSPSVPATVYDIFNGARLARKLIKSEKVDVIHARVHLPAIMGALARKFSGRKPKMIFDIRGFMPEEYTDAGTWKRDGILFRTLKRVENWLMNESDAFVVLTEAARKVLFPESGETGFDKSGRPVEVIPCCIDPRRFEEAKKMSRDAIRHELNLTDREVVVHTGSLGGLYLTAEIVELLSVYRKENPNLFALILTQSNPDSIVPLLKNKGFGDADFLVTKVSPDEIPKFLEAADLAVSFVKAGYATVSRSPTKIPEYLACGLPIVSNQGVGDVDEQIETDKTGAIISRFSDEDYLAARRKIEALKRAGGLAEACRQSARKRFDLEKIGGKRYRRLYSKLISNK